MLSTKPFSLLKLKSQICDLIWISSISIADGKLSFLYIRICDSSNTILDSYDIWSIYWTTRSTSIQLESVHHIFILYNPRNFQPNPTKIVVSIKRMHTDRFPEVLIRSVSNFNQFVRYLTAMIYEILSLMRTKQQTLLDEHTHIFPYVLIRSESSFNLFIRYLSSIILEMLSQSDQNFGPLLGKHPLKGFPQYLSDGIKIQSVHQIFVLFNSRSVQLNLTKIVVTTRWIHTDFSKHLLDWYAMLSAKLSSMHRIK